MKVFKFGGSSVKDATAIKNVAQIITDNPLCRVVVVSATKNTTNELESIGKSSSLSEENLVQTLISKLIERHRIIASELDLSIDLSLSELESELLLISTGMKGDGAINLQKMDSLYSIGERLSSLILSAYLKVNSGRKVFLKDVREVLKTNDQWGLASPLIGKTENSINAWGDLADQDLVITQGFIGSTEKGETTTLGREGSDFSATILGEVLGASEVYIWTDVAGVATCDPRKVLGAKFIPELSYDHASCLAHFGAKVLFERTLEPAIRGRFPVIVKSTLEPINPGTKVHNCPLSSGPIGIAVEDDIVTVVGSKLLSTNIMRVISTISGTEVFKQNDNFVSIKSINGDTENLLTVLHSWLLEYSRN